MATVRVFRGVFREDWQDTDWVDGGTVVTINTDIEIRQPADLDDVDVALYVTDLIGTPVVGPITKSSYAAVPYPKLRVSFTNTAVGGNKMKWLAKIVRQHSIIR